MAQYFFARLMIIITAILLLGLPAKAASPERIAAEKACYNGDANSCMQIGKMLMNGHGGPIDKERAQSAFTKACIDGNGIGCRLLGMMSKQHLSSALKQKKMNELFSKARVNSPSRKAPENSIGIAAHNAEMLKHEVYAITVAKKYYATEPKNFERFKKLIRPTRQNRYPIRNSDIYKWIESENLCEDAKATPASSIDELTQSISDCRYVLGWNFYKANIARSGYVAGEFRVHGQKKMDLLLTELKVRQFAEQLKYQEVKKRKEEEYRKRRLIENRAYAKRQRILDKIRAREMRKKLAAKERKEKRDRLIAQKKAHAKAVIEHARWKKRREAHDLEFRNRNFSKLDQFNVARLKLFYEGSDTQLGKEFDWSRESSGPFIAMFVIDYAQICREGTEIINFSAPGYTKHNTFIAGKFVYSNSTRVNRRNGSFMVPWGFKGLVLKTQISRNFGRSYEPFIEISGGCRGYAVQRIVENMRLFYSSGKPFSGD